MLNCQTELPKVLLEIGPLEVRFYGTMIAISAIIGFFMMKWIIDKNPKKFSSKITKDGLFDIVFWALIGGVLGARFFYVIFYNFNFFIHNPSQIIAVWNGGLSVHGGITGGIIALLFLIKKKKWKFWEIADLLVPFFALGLAFGRIANLVNGELIGRETDWAWGCDFGDGVKRWPYPIFGSLKYFTIFLTTLIIYLKGKLSPGFVSGLSLLMMGVIRFFLEFVRQPDEQLGFIFAWVTMGQILAFLTALAGLGVIIYSLRKKS